MGRRIKALRRRGQLTQEALARQVGVLANEVSRWEAGSRSPGDSNLRALARVLNTSIGSLVDGSSRAVVRATAVGAQADGSIPKM
jgi:transcriptional regulator with XRE-family HTH domain